MKYGAKKTVCGAGHTHDSKLEAGRCDMLVAKEAAGEITHLVQQPEFRCIVDGKLVCRYVADHGYRMADSGLHIVEDTKGKLTPVFNLKRKLVEAIYPGVVISIWPPRVRKPRKNSKEESSMSNAFQAHGIDHLSASSLNLFVAQPALWAASYLMKRRTGVGPAAHRGTAIECGVEAGLFDPEMPVAAAQDMALAKFHALTRLSADPRIEKERDCIAPSVAVALAELRQYGVPEKPADGRQHKIEVTLPGVAIPVIGYLDLLFPQHGLLVDLKTTARIPSEMSDAHSLQGAIYSHAMGNHEVRFAYVSAKKIAVYVLQEPATHLARAVRVAKAIERLLSLSSDGELLTRCFAPDMSSFYWGDASARALATEIWGEGAPDAEPARLTAVDY